MIAAHTSALAAREGRARKLLPGVDDALHLDLAQLLQRRGGQVRLVRGVERFHRRERGVLHHRVGVRLPDLVPHTQKKNGTGGAMRERIGRKLCSEFIPPEEGIFFFVGETTQGGRRESPWGTFLLSCFSAVKEVGRGGGGLRADAGSEESHDNRHRLDAPDRSPTHG